MIGMDRHTGGRIADDAHLAQSVDDILSTPIGSLVMCRDYGSDVPDIIDRPINGETLVDLFQATAEAIDRWEPRLDLTRVEVVSAVPGHVELRLHGERNGDPAIVDVTLGLSEEHRLGALAAGGAL